MVTTKKPNSVNKDTSEKDRTVFRKVERMMQQNKVYRNSSLTLDSLANDIGVFRNMLSRAINSCSGKNFCQYVNTYRVAEAVKLIATKAKTGMKLPTIWKEVGFASRTPFYIAMKEICGLTPTEICSSKKNSR